MEDNCDFGKFLNMDVVDGKWIKARLTGVRGEQVRLAECMGINPDKLSKVLSGARQVQPQELPGVYAYFNETLPDDGEVLSDYVVTAQRIRALSEDGQKKLADYVSLLELEASQEDKDN